MSNKRMNIRTYLTSPKQNPNLNQIRPPDILYDNEAILKLRVRSLDKVSEIKERVAARTQLDPKTISLEYNGKELHESLKLDHCGVNEDGMSLTLTIVEPTPMEEIPWHAPCANMGGPKDLHSSNRGMAMRA
ncbi:hypothetical protein G7Y79_00019g046730 [Physcia stellaris]|nr:hypothetical protein G7Y79_00019g046730 [Physcia stellaris]